jgi:hypothetical protein
MDAKCGSIEDDLRNVRQDAYAEMGIIGVALWKM